MQIDFLANVLGGEGPLHSLLIVLALLGMVLAVLIWAMEFSGWTISRHGFVRNNVPWNSTTIALFAMSAAIYIAGPPIQFHFIPGIGGLYPSLSLPPLFAVPY